MLKRARQVLLIVLLLILPLQGIPHGLSAVLCDTSPDETAAVVPADSEPVNAHAASAYDEDSHGAHDRSAHSCCHQTLWASAASPRMSAPDFTEPLHSSVLVKPTLFIPEQPQRPPPFS